MITASTGLSHGGLSPIRIHRNLPTVFRFGSFTHRYNMTLGGCRASGPILLLLPPCEAILLCTQSHLPRFIDSLHLFSHGVGRQNRHVNATAGHDKPTRTWGVTTSWLANPRLQPRSQHEGQTTYTRLFLRASFHAQRTRRHPSDAQQQNVHYFQVRIVDFRVSGTRLLFCLGRRGPTGLPRLSKHFFFFGHNIAGIPGMVVGSRVLSDLQQQAAVGHEYIRAK